MLRVHRAGRGVLIEAETQGLFSSHSVVSHTDRVTILINHQFVLDVFIVAAESRNGL